MKNLDDIENKIADDFFTEDSEIDRRKARQRRLRLEKMKIEKQKQEQRRKLIKQFMPYGLGGLVAVVAIITGLVLFLNKSPEPENNEVYVEPTTEERALEVQSAQEEVEEVTLAVEPTTPEEELPKYFANTFENTIQVEDVNIISDAIIFIDKESGNILASKDHDKVISPASMTKILTVLVAAEHVTNLDDMVEITIDVTDYCFKNDCSNVGWDLGEKVTVKDLFYGTILPSGADAAISLAKYVAGSHEEFVDMMNDKADELGLSETAHFTNCVGIYNKEHHCTVYDMAMILEAALDNELCREVLSAHTYQTSNTTEHPDGLIISNWFLRRIEDRDTGGEVICAKTGYVAQSRSCAASYGKDEAGNEYICVTAGSSSSWQCIRDQVVLYKQFAKSLEE